MRATAALAGTGRAAAEGQLDAADVLTLQRTAGNAAVGRLLARQPAPGGAAPGPDDLVNPYGEPTPEEAAATRAQLDQELRERVLAPLEGRDWMRFLPQLRALSVIERVCLERDEQFWRAIRSRLSGMALWSVQRILKFGSTATHDVNALSAAVHTREAARIHELLMAYPRLKQVPGLREVLGHQFSGRELTDLIARLDEPDGIRAESGTRSYREAHYEDGVLKRFTGTGNYELVRTATQLRVIVRIRLQEDAAHPGGISERAVERWRQGIDRVWNRRFRARSATTRLDVWFVPVFVYWDRGAHHDVTVTPGDGRSDEHHWHEDDSAGTAAHEFGHMIGNPDEYNLPGAMAEIPAALGLSAEERRRSSYEGITGTPAAANTAGYDMTNIMGAHHGNETVRARHGWDVLNVLNTTSLRRADEALFVLELR